MESGRQGFFKSMFVNSSVFEGIKVGEREWFRKDVWVRHGNAISPWRFSVYVDGVRKEVEMRL